MSHQFYSSFLNPQIIQTAVLGSIIRKQNDHLHEKQFTLNPCVPIRFIFLHQSAVFHSLYENRLLYQQNFIFDCFPPLIAFVHLDFAGLDFCGSDCVALRDFPQPVNGRIGQPEYWDQGILKTVVSGKAKRLFYCRIRTCDFSHVVRELSHAPGCGST